jgi:hypothetical protein
MAQPARRWMEKDLCKNGNRQIIETWVVKFYGDMLHVLSSSVRAGRAIAQAVSRWLPTAAARVQSQVKSCGICGGQSGPGFLRVLWFPLPILIPPTAP